jgi:hypothetical protein
MQPAFDKPRLIIFQIETSPCKNSKAAPLAGTAFEKD